MKPQHADHFACYIQVFLLWIPRDFFDLVCCDQAVLKSCYDIVNVCHCWLLCLHINHAILLCFSRGNMKLLWQFMMSMWVGAFSSLLRSCKVTMCAFYVRLKPITVCDLCINIVYICGYSLLGEQLLSSSGENAPRTWVLHSLSAWKSYSGTDFHSVHVSYSCLLKGCRLVFL